VLVGQEKKILNFFDFLDELLMKMKEKQRALSDQWISIQ
jgi:hypothetical protein